jgi:dTDP-4-dehydrorhamnose 3,5-epimerase-like enzyme
MPSRPTVNEDMVPIEAQLDCIKAIFYQAGENPLFPINVADDRGTFYGFDYTEFKPQLVEIIHSKQGVIRGNHVHMRCTEVFSVLTGEIDMYLLCDCPKKHLFKKRLTAGMTARINPGIAHAIYTITHNESTAIFGDGDPRDDRDRVMLISP